MATVWTITASTTEVTVGTASEVELSLQVANRGDVGGNVTVDVLVSEEASTAWFSVVDPHRYIAANATETFRLKITIPANTMVGTHWVQGRVHSTNQGLAGGSTVSQRVSVKIESVPVVMVDVPDVKNLRMFEAMRKITEASLAVELVGSADQGWFDPRGGNVFAPGDWYVESQLPRASATVPEGTTATLFLRNFDAIVEDVLSPEIRIKFPPKWRWGDETFPMQ